MLYGPLAYPGLGISFAEKRILRWDAAVLRPLNLCGRERWVTISDNRAAMIQCVRADKLREVLARTETVPWSPTLESEDVEAAVLSSCRPRAGHGYKLHEQLPNVLLKPERFLRLLSEFLEARIAAQHALQLWKSLGAVRKIASGRLVFFCLSAKEFTQRIPPGVPRFI